MDNTIRIAVQFLAEHDVGLERIAGGFILRPNNTNRKEH